MRLFNDILIFAVDLYYNKTCNDNITPYIFHSIRASLMVKESLEEVGCNNYTPVYASLLCDSINITDINFNDFNYLLRAVLINSASKNSLEKQDIILADEITNIVLFTTKENYINNLQNYSRDIFINQIISGGDVIILIELCNKIDHIKYNYKSKDGDNLFVKETNMLCVETNKWLQKNKFGNGVLYSVIEKRMWELIELIEHI